MQQNRKRYPGIRPFETSDKDIFFGRDRDIQDLSTLLTLERLVVLFGKSGYGKSSLLNAGLIPWLQDHIDPEEPSLIPLVIRLGSYIEKTSLSPVESMLKRVAEKMYPNEEVDFLNEYLPEDSLWHSFKRSTPYPTIVEGKGIRFLLIFDQFEEFFTYPLVQQDIFKAQLADLLYTDIPQILREAAPRLSPTQRRFLAEPLDIRILFAIRADHISYLDSLKDKLPTILHKRFEIKRLSEQQAKEAIEKPSQQLGDYASPIFEYSPEALKMIFQKLGENQLSKEQSRGIEAFQLQILCEYLEGEVIAGKILNNRILPNHFYDKIDAIYEGYYQRLLDKLLPPIAKAAQHLIEESLIFIGEQNSEPRRLSVDADVLVQRHRYEGITYETLQVLENAFLLRREPNSVGGFNYELSHDTLIRAILSTKKNYTISGDPTTLRLINQAKTAISQARHEQALRFLFKLKVPELDIELIALNGRLVEYQKNSQQSADSWDEKNKTFNRINLDILNLIKSLENAIASSIENYQIVKNFLKKRYSIRLSQKVANRHPINLLRIPETAGFSLERDTSFITYKGEEIIGMIAQIFNEANGRLLLIGAPGTGKTTLLLQLVLELLELESDKLPMLLNLGTWSQKYISLEAWLKKILPIEIGVSEDYASKIIQQNRLILLLDGLDEVPSSDRALCLFAIGEYGADPSRQFLISSRIAEYVATSKDAPVYAQLKIAPLTIEQIEMGLAATINIQPESKRLLNSLKSDPLLRQAIETPFYLNTAQLLFASGKNWSDFGFTATDVSGRQRELVERFVESVLEQKMKEEYLTDKAKASYWLSFLASRMTERNMVVFELRDLQYDWGKWTKWQTVLVWLVYGLVNSLAYGLVGGIVGGLIGALTNRLIDEIIGYVVLGLVFGLVFRLVFELIYGLPQIKTKDSINLTWNNFKKHIKRWWVSNLVLGLTFGLASGIIGALVGGIGLGLAYGLVGVLTGGLALFAVNLLGDSTDFIFIKSPYSRFTASMKNFHFSILQHFHLRYQLYKIGFLPLQLVDFLNELSLRHILEFDGDPTTGKGGGAWRFRHRILQDYFAEKWVEPEENKLKPK